MVLKLFIHQGGEDPSEHVGISLLASIFMNVPPVGGGQGVAPQHTLVPVHAMGFDGINGSLVGI